jgi:hypothetical protein
MLTLLLAQALNNKEKDSAVKPNWLQNLLKTE